MRWKRGAQAPQFAVQDVFGEMRSLADYRGKNLLLSFFRYSSCAICNLRIHHLIDRYEAWRQRGLEILAVFESPRDNVVSNVNKQSVPFPLIADPEARLYDLFGVENSEERVTAAPGNPSRLQGQILAARDLGYPLQREEGGNFFRMPADFLIGPDGTMTQAFYSEEIGSHLSFEEIEKVLC